MNKTVNCPAYLISAPASGTGKTTVVAALARYHSNKGLNVRVFKTGPDFIDPKILEKASRNPVYQLDLWMVGESQCKRLLYEAAKDADLILIEGVMGLFDGSPSSADLAKFFGIPVIAIINAEALAQTFGAIALGLKEYDDELLISGVLANRVASKGHAEMLQQSMPEKINYLGGINRDESIHLPDRHLGLLLANEIDNLEQKINQAATHIEQTKLIQLEQPVTFAEESITENEKTLNKIKIGVAKDDAFSFLYPANLDALKKLGAEIRFFSPLIDTTIPDVDSLYFPGGYPELHANTLANNVLMQEAIQKHHQLGKPIVAECGGMMYLFEELQSSDGNIYKMANILKGKIVMQERLAAIGLQRAYFNNNELRGHTFHYSTMQSAELIKTHAIKKINGTEGEAIYEKDGLTASYIHWYFPSNLTATTSLFSPDAE